MSSVLLYEIQNSLSGVVPAQLTQFSSITAIQIGQQISINTVVQH